MKGKTSIVIAHRLSTIRTSRTSFFALKDGRIVERGTHDELIAAPADSTPSFTTYSSAQPAPLNPSFCIR